MAVWLLYIAISLLAALAAALVLARVLGTGSLAPGRESSAEILEHNRQVVADGRTDAVRFEVVPRGYRPDQVDAVLAQLIAENEELRRGAGQQS